MTTTPSGTARAKNTQRRRASVRRRGVAASSRLSLRAKAKRSVLTGTCHCGAVRIDVPRRPRMLTSCNCSICRRYGVLWAYYRAADVHLVCKAGATQAYSWGRKALKFVRCATCGCVMNWERVPARKVDYMGVNARNLDPSIWGTVRIRLLDGADTWKYLN